MTQAQQLLEWWVSLVVSQLRIQNPRLYRQMKKEGILARWAQRQAERGLEVYRKALAEGVPADLALEQAMSAISPVAPLATEDEDPILQELEQNRRKMEAAWAKDREQREQELLDFLKKEGIL